MAAAASCWVISPLVCEVVFPPADTTFDKFWRIGRMAGLVTPACCNACAWKIINHFKERAIITSDIILLLDVLVMLLLQQKPMDPIQSYWLYQLMKTNLLRFSYQEHIVIIINAYNILIDCLMHYLKLALLSKLSLEIGGGDLSSSSSSEWSWVTLLGGATDNLSKSKIFTLFVLHNNNICHIYTYLSPMKLPVSWRWGHQERKNRTWSAAVNIVNLKLSTFEKPFTIVYLRQTATRKKLRQR